MPAGAGGEPGARGAGPRGGGEEMSTWLLSQAVGHLVCALESHCRELGVSQLLPPSLACAGDLLVWRYVGAAGGNFA